MPGPPCCASCRRRLAAESFRRFRYGDGFSHARALGLQVVLAVIPKTIALVGLSGVVHAEQFGRALRDALVGLTAGSSGELVRTPSSRACRRPDLWRCGLATAMGQVERGANRIYGIQRDRPSWAKYGRAAGLAIVAGLPMMRGLLVLVAGGRRSPRWPRRTGGRIG